MKTEAEIKEQLEKGKNVLITSENPTGLQGFLQALTWVLSDEKPQDGLSD